MIFLVKLNVIKIFAGERRFRDIVPPRSLDSFAHFPAEICRQADEDIGQILHLENRDHHAGGSGAFPAFDLLPHNTSDSHIRHQDNVGKHFHFDVFFRNAQFGIGIDRVAVVSAEVNGADMVKCFLHPFYGYQRSVQILQNIMLREDRTETADAAEGDLVDSREDTLQLEEHHLLVVSEHGGFLGGGYLAAGLQLMYIGLIVVVEFIAAGRLRPFINRGQPFGYGVQAFGRICRQIIYDGAEVGSVLYTGQLFVYIAEVEEHLHYLRDSVIVEAAYKGFFIYIIE